MLDPWLQAHLVCPVDKTPLKFDGVRLNSAGGRSYPVIGGIPVMLVDEVRHTHGIANTTLMLAKNIVLGSAINDGYYLESVAGSDAEKAGAREMLANGAPGIDPIIQFLVAAP